MDICTSFAKAISDSVFIDWDYDSAKEFLENNPELCDAFNLDVIAFASSYSLYPDLESLIYDYDYLLDKPNPYYTDFEDEEEKDEYKEEYVKEFMRELEKKTSVWRLSNGKYVIGVF